MLTDHPEFIGKVVKYKDFGTNQSPNEGSMHGPAVTSLLVGETIGTAPDASVYYASAPSWLEDAQYYADALIWIISENALLSADQKIRVVSVSAAPSGPGTPFSKNNTAWDAAVQEATEQGILVLDCSNDRGITAHVITPSQTRKILQDVFRAMPGWSNSQKQTGFLFRRHTVQQRKNITKVIMIISMTPRGD